MEIKINRIFITGLIFVFIILFIASVSAVPKIEPYVNDFAGLLTKEQISSLNLLSDRIEQNTSWEIAIVTVPNTEGLDRLDYANKLGDENGVGKLDKDNGLVVLWSESDDRGLAVASGRYSESILNDAKLGRILREARFYFDEGKYYDGFVNITLELEGKINGDNSNSSNNNSDTTPDWTIIIFIIAGLIVVAFVLDSLGVWSLGAWSFGNWGSGSGGSGGFSGGFGGGSFSGGGARG